MSGITKLRNRVTSPPNRAIVQSESRMPISVLLDERSESPTRSMSTEEQIVSAVCHARSGTPVGEVCRPPGLAEHPFYALRRRSSSVIDGARAVDGRSVGLDVRDWCKRARGLRCHGSTLGHLRKLWHREPV